MIKKFLNEFKEFILRGNVMDLAVGVIIGAAFKDIVDALTNDFINPLINSIGGAEVGGKLQIFNTNQYINYGHFITAVINFLIMALILFILLKIVNKIMSIGKRPKKEEAPSTKKCPYCLTDISINATRCPHCTSILETINSESDSETIENVIEE